MKAMNKAKSAPTVPSAITLVRRVVSVFAFPDCTDGDVAIGGCARQKGQNRESSGMLFRHCEQIVVTVSQPRPTNEPTKLRAAAIQAMIPKVVRQGVDKPNRVNAPVSTPAIATVGK